MSLMRKLSVALALTILSVIAVLSAQAQTPATSPASQATDAGITANSAIGEVTAIDRDAKVLKIRTDAGNSVLVSVSETTKYMRTAPGAKDLKNATAIALTDIALGDRVWARGHVAGDQKSVPALAIVVMTKADIAQKQDHDREEWKRRGIVGTVTALNPESKEITISVRQRGTAQPVIINAANNGTFRRYAPDSVQFKDAKPSSFVELKVGDQLRALGERSADGAHFTSEEIVSGSFRTIGGAVTAVNAAANEIKISDTQTKQALTIVVRPDTVLKRIPAEFAQMMAARAAGAGGPNGATGGQPQTQGGPQGGPSGAGGGPPRGGFDFQDMLERLPAVTLAELKAGDMIIVSSTAGADPTRLTAIALVSGVEPLLQALQARQAARPNAGQNTRGPSLDINFGIGLP